MTPFCTEKILECWNKEKLIKALATIAVVASLTSLILLAVVRGDVLAQQISDVAPTVTFGDDNPPAAQPHDSFYEETLILLRLVMALLAVAMELGAGLALYDARRLSKESGVNPEALYAELEQVHQGMIARLHETTSLQNEEAVFEQSFWRDFYGAMLSHTTRRALAKLVVFVVAIGFAMRGAASAERLNLVVLVDLTQSVAVQNHDGKTELQKNLDAVGRLLAQVPAGTHVAIAGITDNSFAQPYILLTADVGADEGYFKERLAKSRQQLVAAWRKRTGHLETAFRHTDILGSLLLSNQILEQSRDKKKILVILSDMRQDTEELRLEQSVPAEPNAIIAALKRRQLIGNLQRTRIFALGVDNSGKDLGYRNRLREFWFAYFKSSGIQAEEYSTLREVTGVL